MFIKDVIVLGFIKELRFIDMGNYGSIRSRLRWVTLRPVGISRKGFKEFMKECSKLERSNSLWNQYLALSLCLPLVVCVSLGCLYLMMSDVVYGNNLLTILGIICFFAPMILWNTFHKRLIQRFNNEVYYHFNCGCIHFDRYTILEDYEDGSYNFNLMFSELNDSQLDFLWMYSKKRKFSIILFVMFLVAVISLVILGFIS